MASVPPNIPSDESTTAKKYPCHAPARFVVRHRMKNAITADASSTAVRMSGAEMKRPPQANPPAIVSGATKRRKVGAAIAARSKPPSETPIAQPNVLSGSATASAVVRWFAAKFVIGAKPVSNTTVPKVNTPRRNATG